MLTEQEMPTQWYNIVADMTNKPLPPLHPGTKQALKPEDLYPLFAEELARQEFSTERYIEIPDEVQDLYKIWRYTSKTRGRVRQVLTNPTRPLPKLTTITSKESNASQPKPEEDNGVQH
mgnify:CR=1 FL=1